MERCAWHGVRQHLCVEGRPVDAALLGRHLADHRLGARGQQAPGRYLCARLRRRRHRGGHVCRHPAAAHVVHGLDAHRPQGRRHRPGPLWPLDPRARRQQRRHRPRGRRRRHGRPRCALWRRRHRWAALHVDAPASPPQQSPRPVHGQAHQSIRPGPRRQPAL
eukprot:Amastigsp_a508540_93.p5 type:complete len:163 gc:universal Amastigsp_a508540_93:604-1092(+)